MISMKNSLICASRCFCSSRRCASQPIDTRAATRCGRAVQSTPAPVEVRPISSSAPQVSIFHPIPAPLPVVQRSARAPHRDPNCIKIQMSDSPARPCHNDRVHKWRTGIVMKSEATFANPISNPPRRPCGPQPRGVAMLALMRSRPSPSICQACTTAGSRTISRSWCRTIQSAPRLYRERIPPTRPVVD